MNNVIHIIIFEYPFIGNLLFILLIGGLGYFLSTLHESYEDYVYTSKGDIHLDECKYFLGGVWFHNDQLSVLCDRFDIKKNSLISGKETVQLPFSKIKKVTFEEGYKIYKIKIESGGGLYPDKKKFYIRNKDNFEIVKNKIIKVGKRSLVIEETRTFLNRLSNIKMKKKIIPKL